MFDTICEHYLMARRIHLDSDVCEQHIKRIQGELEKVYLMQKECHTRTATHDATDMYDAEFREEILRLNEEARKYNLLANGVRL